MIPTKSGMALLSCLPLIFGLGCGGFGKVSQGRVIEFDRGKGLVTLIQDSNYRVPGNPKYDVLPPVTVRIPVNPKEMGSAPEAGKRMLLDTENHKIVFYEAATRSFRTVHFTLIERHTEVFRDDLRVAGIRFPVVKREKKSVTLYSARLRELVIFSVADEYMGLPEDTWKAGDEVRWYYKDSGQALRLMNITKTDISSGK